MTQDKHDKSSRNADEKRAKNSAAKPADKDKGIQKARRIDEDVARLKAKELRDVQTVGLSNQDLVADKSTHQLLAGAEQADRDLTLLDEPQAEDAQPDHVAAEQHTPIEKIDADNSELSAGAALDLKATAAEHALGSSPRIGQGGGLKPLGTNQWYSPHSFLSNSELASSLHNAEFKPVPHHLQASLAVKQIAQVKHLQSGAAQPIAMHAEGKQQQSGIVKEDQTSTVSGELHIAGLGSASATWSVESGSGKYGQLVVDPDTGQWRYVLNNSCVDTNALAECEHHTEQFLVFATNNNHQHVKMLVSIEVEGSNDLPVISGLHHASVAEMDKLAKVDGQLLATDPDHNEHLQWALANPHGQFGSLSINATTGEWQYLLDNKSAATLALTEGQQVVEHFVATVTDSSGQAVKHDVSVLVTGSNEQAAISGSFSGIVTEDKNVQAGELHCAGLLQIQDPDAQQASFISEQLQGQFGQFQIDTDGHWTYSVANASAAIQGLKTSESLTDTMLVHSVDGTEKKITITINGTDDKAVISNAHLSSSAGLDKGAPSPDGETYASITEDINVSHGNLTADGALTITDVDNGQAQFSAETLQGQFGTLSINELGHWTYTADNSQPSIQGLKTGESVTDTVLVHSVDGTEQKITITINGTDDKAIIGGTSTANLTEDKDVHGGQLRVDGALTITDADAGQNQFAATSLQGQFGTLSINELGHWTYTADNSQATIQSLKIGELLTDSLLVHSVDGTEQKITVTINGTDDKAQIAGTSTASLTEDKGVHSGQLRVDGTLTVTDLDNGQAQFSAGSLQGQFGTLSINNLGHWTYTAYNSQPSIQGLKTGESITDMVLVHSVDGTEQKIIVTINGTDDKAQIAGTSTASLTEDKDVHSGVSSQELRVDGLLTVTDPDAGQSQFAATSLQGQFGTLSINELGHWTYTADNSQATIQGLKTGEALTDTLLVHGVDGTEQKITVTINGTDDKAVIGGTSTASLTEDKDVHSGISSQELRVDGALIITDVDSGQALFSAETLQGQFGTLTINNLGHWTYTADNSQATIQSLKTGESLTDSLLVHSVDGTEQKITVTINGTDDKAQIAGTSTASLTEDKDVHSGQLRVDGTLTVTDLDNGQAQFSAGSLQGQFGTLSINNLGHWTYTAYNSQPSIQGLKAGESITDMVLVHSVDGTEQKITVTINGTDDKAIIAGTSTASLTEDKDVHSGVSSQELRVDGALTVTDADNGQAQFTATSLQGQFGTLSINELGHWTYTTDNSQPTIQGLKTGESVTDTVFVHSVDGTEQKIIVTIDGTDDKAQIAGAFTANLTEDKDVHSGQLRVDGALTVTDADNGEAQFTATSLQGQFGTLSINELGHWTYTADNSQATIQGLKNGEALTDTLLVHSVDGTEQKITVTINGTDDKAQIAGTSRASLTEDKDVHSGQLKIDGSLTVTDSDNGQSQFAATSLQGQFGILSINNLGHWIYTADNSQPSIQGLKTGESVTDAVLVHSIDGTEQKITVTINGTDDKAQIAGASTANITEDKDVRQGQLRVDGALNVTDSDNGQAQFSAETLKGQFGTLTINELGHWTYTAENSQATIQGLKTGEALTDTLVVHSVDGTEQKITVTINGTDDKAVIAGTATASLTEDKDVHSGLLRVDGALTITDSDNGQAQFSAETLQGQFGTLTINNLGHWTYTADNSQATIQGLKTGESVTDTLLVHSVDGTEQQVTVTINGTDDKAVIAGSATASLTEDKEVHAGQLRADGALTVTDLDNGQAQFQAESLQGQYGTLTLNSLGHWTYTADNSKPIIQGLQTGESLTDTLVVHSVDGTSKQISVTINGSDDKAVIAGTATANLTEDKEVHAGQLRADGALTVTDLDNGQAQFQAESLQGQYGTLTLNNLGHWTYIADNSKPTIQGLQSGESLTDSLVVHSVDGTSQQISVTINGSDDKAVIAGTSTANLTEDKEVHAGQLRVDGALTVTDLDNGQAQFQAESLQGQYGTLTLNNLGHWTYTADNSKPVIQGLQTGESLTDTLVVHSVDGTSQQISITINGSNDKPIVTAWTQLASGTEDKPVTIKTADLLKHATDVDATDILQVDNLHATNGHLTDNKDGSYTFTPDKDFNGEVRLTYNVIDGHGGSVGTQAKFDLAAAPDQAVITDAQTDDNLRGVTEDRGYIDTHYKLHYNGQLNIHDPDVGQDHFDPNIGPQTYEGIGYDTKLGGHVVLTPDGHYTYTLDNRKVQNLAEGEVKQDSVVIRSADGTAHTIELSVHGTNDRPTIAAQSHSLIEGGAILHGKMVGQDVDTGAVLQYSAPKIDGLIFNSDGSYSFDPSNSSYQSLSAGTTKTLTIPVTITDEHNAHSTQNLSIIITGVNNAAVIGGVDTGDVNEATAGRDMSPDYAQSGMSLLGRSPLYANGAMTITDLDAGEETFNSRGLGYNYTGKYGDLMLREDGSWSYYADAGNIGIKGGRSTSRGTEIDHLGDGQTLTDTITVYSKDGTAHDIVITIHGSNDRPYCSSEVTLNVGSEDTRQTITAAQLLSNTVDVDRNDAGLLTIENLHVDHGSIAINPDGSYLFTPEKDYNGAVKFNYDIKDGHGGITHTQAKLTLTASQDAATFTGDSTGDVHEGHTFTAVDGTVSNGSVGDRSPDHQHGNIGKLWNDEIHTDGHLNINDADSGESHAQTGIYHGNFGQVILQTNGDWSYYASIGQDATGRTIDKLGQGQSLTDTVTIKSSDGTPHNIVITIHGSNDRPYCSSEVQLNAGTEDTRQTITVAQLLTNTVDVDNNDIGLLTIENLHPDHGSIATNSDGSFSFTPEKDYNGQVHFTYDVKDGHGGITHTSASTTLSAVNDNPDVSPLADSIKEGASHNLDLLTGATDIEGDTLHIEQLTYSIDGAPSTTQLPSGLSLAADGHTLMIDATDPAYNHLANGQSLKIAVSYLVNDGHGGQSQQTANLTIQGTDDKATLVSNVIQLTETQALDSQFKTYKGNLQLVDPDTGDKTHFAQLSGTYLGQGFAPGNLDVWSDGSYQFRLEGASNRHADDLISSLHTGESLEIPYEVKTSDGQTLTIMVKVIGEDNQARIEVGRYSSFNEHAYEDNLSPGSTPNQIYSGGNLHVIDPDHDQAGFIAQNLTTPEGGHFFINARGNWAYTIDNDKLQHLGAGQSYQKTFTVESIDGSAHQNITVTVHGTNDAPVVSAQVQLAAGTEDTDIQLSTAELIANATDVDDNDAGQLSIANLTADHGTITVNPNGTFTFHPQKDYNGQVHFSYDVKDAHGGVTHTGATTTLAAVQDSAVITEVNTGSIIEDGPHGSNTNGTVNEIATGTLNVTDPDSGENAFRYSQFGETKIHDPFGGMLRIDNGGSWGYSVNNANLQHLAEGQTEVVIYRVHSKDGTPYDLHINVTGTNDAPTVNQVHLTNGTEDVSYQMQASQFGFSDVDSGDTLHSISLTNLPSLTEGKFVLDGHDVSANQIIDVGDISKLQFIPAKDFHGDVHFSYTVNDGHVDSAPATGSLNIASVEDLLIDSGVRDLGVTDEDTSTHFTEAQLLEHLSDVDGPLHVSGLPTSAHGAVTANASGGYDFTPTPNYHGPAEIDYKVTDGSTEYAKTAQLSVTPITDTAQVGLSMTAQQQVMQLGTDGSASAMNNGGLQTGDQINSVAVEFNVIGGPQVTSGSTHGATYFSYANSESDNEMYAWKPSNLTIAIHGTEYATGIDTTQDTATHRYSILWDSNTGVLQVLVDGDVKFTHANVHKGQPMNGHGTLAIGQDQDVVHGQKFVLEDGSHKSHGFGVNDAFHGQIFSTSMVTNHPVAPASLQHAPLANTVDKDNGLVIDMRMSASGQLVDMTGHHQLTSFGSLTSHTVSVDTGVAIPNSDSLLNLSPHIVDPVDPDDHISKVELLGLISGTVITDGTPGHNHVVSSMTDALNIQGWDLDHLTAQLPGGNNHNMDIIVRVETTGPDGATSTTEAHQPLVLDPTKPIPNAVISGDDNKTTDEDTSISGQLLITDTDAAQAHFDTTPIDGKYGHLTIDSDGHWTYTPNATANALNKTDHVQDALIVTSLDGTQHQIVVNIDGRDDNPIVTELAAPKTVIEDGGHDHVRTSGMLSISDPDTGDTHSITEQTDVLGTYGHFSIAANGGWHYELDNALPATQALTEGQHVTETFNVVVTDNEGGQTTHTMHFDVQGSNEAPTITASTISAYEDTDYHFTKADFGFTDSDGGSLEHLTITELPPKSQGELSLNGHAITANQQISNADIPNLVFTPNLNFNGNVNFKYSVSDGHDSSAEAQATIDVASRNDAPTITPNSLSGTEDNTYSFNEADFGFTDVDNGDTLNHITITDLPDIADGKLTLNGVEVTTNQQISATDIGQLKFEPSANFHGDVDFAYSVNDGHVDSAPARASIHIASVDDPLIDSGMRDLGTTDEDTTTHFTDAQLLANLSDADGALHISGVPTSTHGTVTANASGGYDFTPNANYHGPAEIDYKVSDGTTEYAQTAHLSVSSVTDAATTSLSAEVQRTAFGLTSSSDHGYIKPHGDQIESGGDLHAFTAEFTYIHDPKITIGTYQDFVMFHGVKPDGTPDMDGVNFGMWTFGGNLKFTSSHISGDNGNPGVNFNDGQDHRITMTWDGKTDTALLYDNGVLKVTVHGFAGSDHIAANPFLNVGSKYVPGHFAGQDKFPGRLLSTSFASQALTPEQIQHGPVYESVSKNNGLLIDIRSDSHGLISDQTGHHQLDIADLHTFTGEMVNTGSTALAPGDVLHMHLSVAAPIDHDDVLSKIEILGLAKGTILSDGHHSLTIGSAVQHADVTGWDLDKVTATLPAHGDQNMLMQLVATTTGPDGISTTDSAKLPIILDVNSPVPDAVITGDEQLTTDEVSTVSGQLTITDTDPSQAHFIAEVIPSAHGQFTIKADGSWEFTPSKLAETLTQNHNATDIVTVKTLDGTEQQLSVTLIGSDTAPTTVTTDLGMVESGHTHDFQATDLLANVTDVDTSAAGLSIVAGSLLSPHGTVVTNPDGSYSFTANPGFVGNDLAISFKISDGHNTIDANAIIDVTPSLAITRLERDTGVSDSDFVTSDGHIILYGTGEPGSTIQGSGILSGPKAIVDANGHWKMDVSATDRADGTYTLTVFEVKADGSYAQAHHKITIDTAKPTLSIDPISNDDWVNHHDHQQDLTITGATTHVADGNSVDVIVAGTHYSASVNNNHWQLVIPANQVANISDNAYQVHAEVIATATGDTAQVQRQLVVSADLSTLVQTQAVEEDSKTTAAGTIFAVGASETVTTAGILQGNYGTLQMNADGSYQYTLDNNAAAIQQMGQTDSHADNFFISYTNNHGDIKHAVVNIGIHGTNDAPLLTGTFEISRSITTGSMTNTHSFGYINIDDIDAGDNLNIEYVDSQGGHHLLDFTSGNSNKIDVQGIGHFSIDADGRWDFTFSHSGPERDKLDQEVAAGKIHTETVTLKVTDGSGQSREEHLTVHIGDGKTGPQIFGASESVVTEDKVTQSHGLLDLLVGDVKVANGVTWELQPGAHPQYGDLTLNSDGSWQYQANNDSARVQALAEGERLEETIMVTATDSLGHSVDQAMKLVIIGTNDVPVVGHALANTVVEDHLLTLSKADLLANVHDTDAKDVLDVSHLSIVGGGTITQQGDHWVINPRVNYNGELRLNYTVTDGHVDIDNSMAIHVSPDADTPTMIFTKHVGDLASPLDTMAISGNENSDLALNINVSSPDTNETLTVEITGVPPGASLSAGTENNGIWTLQQSELTNLKVIPEADFHGHFDLSVSAISRDGSEQTSVSQTIGVDVLAAPVLAGIGQSDAPQSDTETDTLTFSSSVDADFSDAVSTGMNNDPIAPVDHYFQMLGMSRDDTPLESLAGDQTDILPEFNVDNPLADADDLALQSSDPFDNPLAEGEDQHHQLDDVQDNNHNHSQLVDDNTAVDSHDDLLHQALNDMHNQW
ncbi:VCBS domain-containing protein [Agarivorans sp. TSD2052]|uniref:VCBS domain-containing protein n=1 Tax=Agarivorans sp. TSD2052 TaxID=2937286 RepID=UPI00200FC98A|nr:VCBS domain-containing protein [Agarivorans sp. TSD2052]UPW17253.1 VCBS domain-containing protein [Agarivorans sp. TSD2052]